MDPAALLDGLTERQAEAVASPGAPLCILAGAGSGEVVPRLVGIEVAVPRLRPAIW